jgi:hypothetical protein
MTVVNVPGVRFVTTPQVLLECGNAVARKPYRADVCLLRDRLSKRGDPLPGGDAKHSHHTARSAGDGGRSDLA